eukprot:scaffold16556_cov63-Phaeocystis_antarctica.AAC.3
MRITRGLLFENRLPRAAYHRQTSPRGRLLPCRRSRPATALSLQPTKAWYHAGTALAASRSIRGRRAVCERADAAARCA